MAHIVLLLGGARSGKSRLAEQLAQKLTSRPVLFIATAEVRDEEMKKRVERHRQTRPSSWRTLEAPFNVGRALRESYEGEEVVILDCLTLWVANVLTRNFDTDSEAVAALAEKEVDELLATLSSLDTTAILVTNEVGMGLVPPYPLGRVYRDVLGRVNQQVAAHADEVFLLVAGIPVPIKTGEHSVIQ